MAETSWPGPGPATVTEHMHELLWAMYYQSGQLGPSTQQSLIFGDGTGLQVKARASRYALVRGQVWSSGDTVVTVPIAANASGSTRLDRVVLRLDRSTWEVRLAVVQGTPGAGEPSITQDEGPAGVWELWVATVTVTNGAASITANDVSSRDLYLGSQLLMANQGDLPNPNVPGVFLRWLQTDGALTLHTQGASAAGVRDLYRDSGEVTLASSNTNWEASVVTAIRRINSTVHLRYGSVQRTGGSFSQNVNSVLPGIVPSSMIHPDRNQYATVRTATGVGRVSINYAGDALPGRIVLTEHPGITTGGFVSGFTITWLVP